MKPYADVPALRLRQLLGDAATLLWVTAWLLAGRALYRSVDGLRFATGRAEDAGAGFADRLGAAARTAGTLPVVGAPLRRPLAGAADAGRALQSAGAAAGDTLHTLALWFGLLVALVPIVWLVGRYVPGRLRWMQEARAAERLVLDADDLQLLALRAAATAPLHVLRRVTADPAAALARAEFERLASIELRRLGLVSPKPR